MRIMGAEVTAGGAQQEALEAAKSTFLRIHYNGVHRYAVSQMTAVFLSRSHL